MQPPLPFMCMDFTNKVTNVIVLRTISLIRRVVRYPAGTGNHGNRMADNKKSREQLYITAIPGFAFHMF